jgi:hypothetical protein
MKKFTPFILLSFFFLMMVSLNLKADPPSPAPPDPGGTPSGTGEPVGAPIDRGLPGVLLLGALYGVKRLRQEVSPSADQRKKSTN